MGHSTPACHCLPLSITRGRPNCVCHLRIACLSLTFYFQYWPRLGFLAKKGNCLLTAQLNRQVMWPRHNMYVTNTLNCEKITVIMQKIIKISAIKSTLVMFHKLFCGIHRQTESINNIKCCIFIALWLFKFMFTWKLFFRALKVQIS